MKITKRQLRRIIREAVTSYEQEVGEQSTFVEANWIPWLEENGLGVEDLDDLAHKFIDSGHSKVPVYENNLDHINKYNLI